MDRLGILTVANNGGSVWFWLHNGLVKFWLRNDVWSPVCLSPVRMFMISYVVHSLRSWTSMYGNSLHYL